MGCVVYKFKRAEFCGSLFWTVVFFSGAFPRAWWRVELGVGNEFGLHASSGGLLHLRGLQ